MMDNEYSQAIEQAKANLADIRERGADALIPWETIKRKFFTPEEIAQAEIEAALMHERIQPRHEQKILSEVRQPVLAN